MMKQSNFMIFLDSDNGKDRKAQFNESDTNTLENYVMDDHQAVNLCSDLALSDQNDSFKTKCLMDELNFYNASFTDNPSSPFNFSLNQALDILLEGGNKGYLDSATEIIFGIFYSILICFGVFGNVMVGYIIWRKKTMRTSRNMYILNLTISDLSMCIICMPFTLVGLLYKEWTLGNVICKLVPVIQATNILVSTATIVAIAGERYFSIVRVGRFQRQKWHVAVSLIAIWTFSLLFTLPLISCYYVHQVKFGQFVLYRKCIEKWPTNFHVHIKEMWIVLLLVSQYIFPILVLAVVHGSIKRYLNCHIAIRRDERRANREMIRNRRTTILLSTIAISFAVSWLPWHVANLLADFNYHKFTNARYLYTVFGYCHIIAMSTACSNPVLYGWLNTNLRRELLDFVPSSLKLSVLLPKRFRGMPNVGLNGNNIGATSIMKAESITLCAYQEHNGQTQDIDDQQITTAISVDEIL